MTKNVDWFVASTGVRGDGSREHPFHDPWMAFRRAEPGDTVHIAAGVYDGRFDRSSWIIECPRLTVLGGYSRDFSTRTPWKTPAVFGCYPGYEYARENSLLSGRGDHSDLILDGLCFDAAGRNRYGDKPGDGVSWIPAMDGVAVSLSSRDVTIRNCVIANSGNGGMDLTGSGSRVENNLFINVIGLAMLHLRSSTQLIDRPIVVKGNSFCFMHDMGDPAGSGGDQSQGIRVNCPAAIEDNVFVSCGNAAIAVYLDLARVAIERNLFFASPHDVIESKSGASKGEIREKNLEELEDLGFKACAGNVVQNPALAGLAHIWLEAYSRDLLARYATPPRDAIATLRAAAGLTAIAAADLVANDQKGAVAPRYPVDEIGNLASAAKQGFHAVELPVALTPRVPEPDAGYRRIEWPAMVTADPGLANTRVELRVGFGSEQNTQLLTDAPVETHMGVRVYDPGSDDNSLYVLIPRHSFAARQYGEARNYQRGKEVEKTYWLRGVYRSDTGTSRQKATLIVAAIEPAPMFAPPLPARPAGRDWFVRAGSTGGDGSREKPFRDPFQALEKCEGGDAIHVATGEYFGKLRSGKWLLTMRNLSLLGGYDAEFAARDPWANPTRFSLDAEEKAKGRPSGTPLYSEENSDGLVLDGFIFDGASWNTYKDGSLDLETSPLAPLVRLRGLDAPITVRNCLFLNASDGAVVLDCALAIFENNVVVNTSSDALVLNANGAGPAVVRNNTILFACDPTERAGTGKSSSRGTLIQLKGRGGVTLDSNIIGFADNYGIRAALPQDNVELRNNAFGANLFNHLCDCQYLFADGTNWVRRVETDSAYALEGNKLGVSAWPVDKGYLDQALARLFALPSRIGSEEWKSIAAAVGASVRPVEMAAASAQAGSAPPPEGGLSALDALMAKMSSVDKQVKEAGAAKPEPEAPKYCPVYDWKQALALVTEGADSAPGAHRRKLDVAFAAPQVKVEKTYSPLDAAQLDALRPTLNEKPVSLGVTELRDSSSNPSVYAPGTDRRDYSAFGVTAVDSTTRTRIALVVRADTDVSRRIGRVQTTDKLDVRGTAYHTSGESGLTILVDSFDLIGA
jgi:parallel beta helix pectate lyase-like protein